MVTQIIITKIVGEDAEKVLDSFRQRVQGAFAVSLIPQNDAKQAAELMSSRFIRGY
ncbi:MAG: hypothetical protein WAW52_01040 [Methanothrix sp.]